MANNLTTEKARCTWVPLNDPLYVHYHDQEWGVPVHNDQTLFEFLILEGMQAGLSWKTILHKREHYRNSFYNFDPLKVARFSDADIAKLLENVTLVRNRLKIEATVKNAKAFLKIQEKYGSFDQFLWQFTEGKTIHTYHRKGMKLPASSKLSETISCELKQNGMKFVGPIIVYSFLQAIGIINDHEVECFRFNDLISSKI